MAVIKVRLCDLDREEYGGPEELTVDVEALKDLRAGEHESIDGATNMALSMFIPLLEDGPLKIAHVGRLAAWLGLRNAGIDVDYKKFDPRLMRATVERVGDDERPPAIGSSTSSSGEGRRASSSKR